ncbi:MAG: LytTR family transcriptional regulator [Sphingobacteriales bacterium]|nr:MAG: LytTR family transcriptional regulator [Sphingobacteriales bacterium]
MVVRKGGEVEIVPLIHLLYIEARGSYSRICYEKEGKQQEAVMSYSVAEYEDMLPDELFFRLHKSYLVNCMHLDHLTKDAQPVLKLKGNQEIPVSRRRYPELLRFLQTKFRHG